MTLSPDSCHRLVESVHGYRLVQYCHPILLPSALTPLNQGGLESYAITRTALHLPPSFWCFPSMVGGGMDPAKAAGLAGLMEME